MGTYALTGGATGIGAAIKNRLLGNGHRVIVADIKEADVEADLSTADGRNAAIRGIREAAGAGLDGLVTSAGVASHVPDHGLITGVNYFGTTGLVEGLKDLVGRKQGSIVLIASNSAPQCQDEEFIKLLLADDETAARTHAETMDGQQVYAGTKLALVRWMRHNTVPLAKLGMTINAIAPGYTETPMTQATHDDPAYGEAIKQFLASIPVGRPGQPDDMANMAEFLLSDKARFVCGTVMFVDGGHDAMFRPDSI